MTDLAVIGLIVSLLALVLGTTDLFWGWLERHDVPARIDQATRDAVAHVRDAEHTDDLDGWEVSA